MERFFGSIASHLGPVLSSVLAALLLILGVLVIVFPQLIGWVVGIGLALAGVALIAVLITRGQSFDD